MCLLQHITRTGLRESLGALLSLQTTRRISDAHPLEQRSENLKLCTPVSLRDLVFVGLLILLPAVCIARGGVRQFVRPRGCPGPSSTIILCSCITGSCGIHWIPPETGLSCPAADGELPGCFPCCTSLFFLLHREENQ